MEIGSFQDGNPMEICCKLMVSMFFPHVFPEGKLPFFALPLVHIYLASSNKRTKKQEAHGPHRSHEKTVQINRDMIIIILIKRRKKPIIYLMRIE